MYRAHVEHGERREVVASSYTPPAKSSSSRVRANARESGVTPVHSSFFQYNVRIRFVPKKVLSSKLGCYTASPSDANIYVNSGRGQPSASSTCSMVAMSRNAALKRSTIRLWWTRSKSQQLSNTTASLAQTVVPVIRLSNTKLVRTCQPRQATVGQANYIYKSLEEAYDEETFQDVPRAGLIDLGTWTCQAYSLLLEPQKSLIVVEKVLRDSGLHVEAGMRTWHGGCIEHCLASFKVLIYGTEVRMIMEKGAPNGEVYTSE
ncbi:hypothetical protein M409DRAFT_61719 [Zasmidium cellare ATCC 36951]|uniref:Uncharacterized protein n=1 Tax=Zasmidium cellare ATCC 36951 TaxID=1080233 RepID=A0A6A6BU91_ZASCE|nr:uncharacterized protein M409DRAFT_61719 [Zasmidium cellare ATCC 36951]KAF2158367.1 hypothetical protein M409DRAFT_61719 [Zasmidium cellare ATCC 36951]